MSLKEWFEEKDYGIGLALFGQLSKNRILFQNLSRKKNPEKLEYELRKIAEHQGIDLTEEVEDPEENTGKVIQLNPDAEGTQTPGPGADGDETKNPGQDPAMDETQKNDGESHSDQVVDQMNAEKIEELKENADQVVSDKLQDLESEAEDIVSVSKAEIQDDAEQIIDQTKNELEVIANEIISGKLKIIRDGKEIDFNTLSPEMKARWDQNRDSYKEQRVLHEKLKLMANATPEDRQPLTQRMCDLDDQIRDNWAEIDAFVPGANNNEPASTIDYKRIQANRKYISTNLKKLPEQTDPVKTAQVVTELQKRYDEIKASGEAVSTETIEELTKAGVKC